MAAILKRRRTKKIKIKNREYSETEEKDNFESKAQ